MKIADLLEELSSEQKPAATQLYIDGRWVDPVGKGSFTTNDPATGEVIAHVAGATSDDVDLAVTAARRAFVGWSRVSGRERQRVLLEAGRLVTQHREVLARIEARDSGKLLAGAQGDIDEVAFQLEYFAGWATKITGDATTSEPGSVSLLVREPVGVAALISPWNFPMLLANQKVAPAIAAGCTVILKPAEQTSLTAIALAAILEEAGLPSGVFNLLTGDGQSTGVPLVRHRDVDKVSFTGSTEVGKEIVRASADTMKRVSMELGGKSPAIVYADADFDAAVAGVAKGIFWNQGQVCGATSRLLVEDSIKDDFVAALSEVASSFVLGHGFDPATTMGPVISEAQRQRVEGYVKLATDAGARIAGRGSLPTDSGLSHGTFHEPIVLDDVTMSMRVAQEEIFGPVLSVMRFSDMAQAVSLANDTRYGLAASVWTRDIDRAFRTARSVRAGSLWINDALQAPSEAMFGGFGESGYGRELGRLGLDEYLEYKHVFLRLGAEDASIAHD